MGTRISGNDTKSLIGFRAPTCFRPGLQPDRGSALSWNFQRMLVDHRHLRQNKMEHLL